MSVIVKTYNATFISNLIVEASDVRRALDDLYDEINGNLNSDNFGQTGIFMIADKVTISQTTVTGAAAATFSASSLEDQLILNKPQGYNGVHVLAFGTAGFTILPGLIEVNGRTCIVNAQMDLAATDIVHDAATTASAYERFLLLVNRTPILTASDFMLTRFDDIVGSTSVNGLVGSQFSYLFTSGTNTRRGICVMTRGTTTTAGYRNEEYLQTPNKGLRYELNSANGQGLYWTVFGNIIDPSTAADARITSVTTLFDFNTNRYYFEVGGNLGGDSATFVYPFASYGTYEVIGCQTTWYVDRFSVIDSQSRSYLAGSFSHDKTGTNCIHMYELSGTRIGALPLCGTEFAARFTCVIKQNPIIFGNAVQS